MPVIRSNGIDVYYEVRGAGKPLLLIQGLGIDLTQVESLANGFARSRRVVVFDNRGAGRTDKPDAPYSVELMAEDTAGLITGLELDSCDVIGISMGGRIAISLALAHPNLVKSLVLALTSARVERNRGIFWEMSNILLRVPAVRAIGTKYPQPYYAYVRQREASSGYDVTSRLSSIQNPTLIVRAKNDRIVPAELTEELLAGIGGSKLVEINGGHTSFISKPNELIKLITEFLDGKSSNPT